MKRTLLFLLCIAMLVVPIGARAETTTYSAPYQLGWQYQGDANNTLMPDEGTGEVTVIRHQAAGISGGLGCGGNAAYSYLRVVHEAETPVTSFTVNWEGPVFTSFGFINISVRKDGNYLNTEVVRQPFPTDPTTLTVEFPAATGTLDAQFGVQLSSACPNVEIGRATFTSVTFA